VFNLVIRNNPSLRQEYSCISLTPPKVMVGIWVVYAKTYPL